MSNLRVRPTGRWQAGVGIVVLVTAIAAFVVGSLSRSRAQISTAAVADHRGDSNPPLCSATGEWVDSAPLVSWTYRICRGSADSLELRVGLRNAESRSVALEVELWLRRPWACGLPSIAHPLGEAELILRGLEERWIGGDRRWRFARDDYTGSVWACIRLGGSKLLGSGQPPVEATPIQRRL